MVDSKWIYSSTGIVKKKLHNILQTNSYSIDISDFFRHVIKRSYSPLRIIQSSIVFTDLEWQSYQKIKQNTCTGKLIAENMLVKNKIQRGEWMINKISVYHWYSEILFFIIWFQIIICFLLFDSKQRIITHICKCNILRQQAGLSCYISIGNMERGATSLK